MDKISKSVLKLDKQNAQKARDLFKKIKNNDLVGLDTKKLKGFENFYRVRFGKIRIIFEDLGAVKKIVFVNKKGDNTYNIF